MANIDVPPTFAQRMAKEKTTFKLRHPDSPDWFSRDVNKRAQEKLAWAAPYDARFPQARKQRMCFAYYVDFHRCHELMGKQYEGCKFFQNVYSDICPKFWIEKWDELRTDGRFPARFDR